MPAIAEPSPASPPRPPAVRGPDTIVRALEAVRDYAKRLWDNSADDNIFFLAGGISFNLLLAAVPFFLLSVSGIAWLLGLSAADSSAEVTALFDRLLPPHPEGADTPVHAILGQVLRVRGRTTIVSAIVFIWFSTRLFGSLRSVLAEVFDLEQERGIIAGKIFDVQITVVSTLLVIFYAGLSAYLGYFTTRGAAALAEFGVGPELLRVVEYGVVRFVAFFLITVMFYALYKFLPRRRIRSDAAWLGAAFTGVMFEIARHLFNAAARSFNPASLYTGTLAAVVIIVAWVYYASLIFILGGEVGQVYHLRRVWRHQRAVLE
jgi:membrane protein